MSRGPTRMREAWVGSPRLRLGPFKDTLRPPRSPQGPHRSPSRDGSTRRKGLRFAPIALRATRALAPGARATPDGERRDPQTAQQPATYASAQRKNGPGSTPLRRSPSRPSGGAIGVPSGVIAPESGLTARLPRGTGPSVAQEHRFDLPDGREAIGRARTRPRGQESTKAGAGYEGGRDRPQARS